MEFLQRKFATDAPNFTDICYSQCRPSDDDEFCISDCFNFCLFNCPDRLPPFPPPSSHHSVLPKRFIAATVVLGITVISLICLTVYYKFYSGPCIRRRRSGGDERRNQINEDFINEDHGPVLDHPIWYINTVGLQPSVINSITVCKYKKGDGLVEGTDCSVCLSEFEEDETLRLLPKCSHAFHTPCIDTWLRSHTNCPLCRAPIVVSNPNLEASPSNGGGETQIGGNREGSGESGDGELRIDIREEDEFGLQDDDRGKRSEVEEGIQPLRRSVSVDSLSAFNISQALAVGVHGDDLVKENESIAPKRIGTNQGLIRFMASSSIGRSLQIGPSSMKRSFSCGAKLFLQRYSRNSNSSSSSSVLPL